MVGGGVLSWVGGVGVRGELGDSRTVPTGEGMDSGSAAGMTEQGEGKAMKGPVTGYAGRLRHLRRRQCCPAQRMFDVDAGYPAYIPTHV